MSILKIYLVALAVWTVVMFVAWFVVFTDGTVEAGETGLGAFIMGIFWVAGVVVGSVVAAAVAVGAAVTRAVPSDGEAAPEDGSAEVPPPG